VTVSPGGGSSSQASSLRTGRPWTLAHLHGPGHAGRSLMDATLPTRNSQLTRATGPSERAGWLFWADQDCRLHSASIGLTCGLSKAREGQPSAGSNPAATALCNSSNVALAQAVNPVRSLNRSSRVDHAGDTVCHLSAIEGDSPKPPPEIEDSNCARRVNLPTGHLLPRTRRHPRIHGHIRGLRRAV
jgi:hypothetical protein